MKLIVATLAMLLTGTLATMADQPGKDWISVEQAKAKLRDAGYTSVTKIEADDGHYEGKGMKNGQTHEFHVDPHSGAVTKDEIDD